MCRGSSEMHVQRRCRFDRYRFRCRGAEVQSCRGAEVVQMQTRVLFADMQRCRGRAGAVVHRIRGAKRRAEMQRLIGEY